MLNFMRPSLPFGCPNFTFRSNIRADPSFFARSNVTLLFRYSFVQLKSERQFSNIFFQALNRSNS